MYDDEFFMREALKEAQKAYKRKEVPVGSVLVYQGKVIARSHNQVEMLQDATAHSEMLTLTIGASHLHNWRLLETTLYTTLEPCAMCAGAILLSRVPRVVYGARDVRHGAHGSFVDLFGLPHPTHTVEIIGGVLSEPSAQLLKEFFRERRDTTSL